MLAAFLTAFFFALSSIFAQRSTRLVGVFRANFARLWTAAPFLAVWAHGFGGGLRGAGLGMFVLSGVVGFGLGDLGLFAALPLIGARLTTLLVQCLAAPAAAVIEWLWLGATLRPVELCCAAAILGGVGIAVAPDKRSGGPDLEDLARQPARRRGILCGSLAALGQAGGAVMSRRAHTISEAAGLPVDGGTATYQRILGGLLVVTLAYLVVRRRSAADPPRWRAAWPWVLGNSLIGAVVGVSFYQRALATTPSAVVLPIVALTPLIVVPFAYFAEREHPSARSLLGGALAVAGAVVLASRR